jgi:hypothetical protein
MRKTLLIAGILIAGLAGPASAYQCPLLIKQLNDAVAPMNAADPKVKQGKELIAEAKRLHEAGKHAEAIATAEKAARTLGVQLKLAKMTPEQEAQVRAAEQKILK